MSAQASSVYDFARVGNLKRIRYLVEKKGVSVNKKNWFGRTPLHEAASRGHLDVVKYLLDKGAAVNEKGEYGKTPLYLAALEGHLDVVKYLIDKGAVVNKKNIHDVTPLHAAADQGRLGAVKYLISKGAAVNEKNKKGETPLHLAAEKDHVDVVKYLINKGAAVNEKGEYGKTPLYIAASRGHLGMIEYLVEKGATVDEKSKDDQTPLHLAASHGHLHVVKYLLDKGAAVNEKSKSGKTPLHLVAYWGGLSVVEYLIDKGATVNEKSEDGKTPLHIASFEGRLSVVKYLIVKGAEVNTKTKNGETPLHLAAEYGHLDVVEYLIDKGAVVNAKNTDDETPLRLALRQDHADVVDYLIDKEPKATVKATVKIKSAKETVTNSLVRISNEDSRAGANAVEATSHDGLETIVHHKAAKSSEGNINGFRDIAEISEQDVNDKAQVQLPDGTEKPRMVPEYAAVMVESLLDASALGEEARPMIEYLQQHYGYTKHFVDRYCKDYENSEVLDGNREDAECRLEKIGERITGLKKYAFDDVVPRHMVQLRFICSKKLRQSVQEYHEELSNLVSDTRLSDSDDLNRWKSQSKILQTNHQKAWSTREWDEIDLPLVHQVRVLELGIRIENDLDQEFQSRWFPVLRNLPAYYHQSAELDFSKMTRCGEGGFGIIYIGQWADETAAFKVSNDIRKTNELVTEANTSFPLRHRNVIDFWYLTHTVKGWTLIFEYAAHGDIKTFLEKRKDHDRLKYLELALKLLLDAARGLVWVHQRDIIHNDLHAKNILICSTKDGPVAKISDFGLALKEQGSAPTVLDRRGSKYWHAPEYDSIKPCITNAADVFAFGTCFYQALHPNQAPPWNDHIAAISVVKSGHYPSIDDDEKATQLFRDMCHFMPHKRPTSEQVVVRLTALLEQVQKQA